MHNRDLSIWIGAGVGFLLWGMTALAGHRPEPWDTALYWSLSYPAALALAAILGFAFPRRAWRAAAALIGAQLPVMLLSGAGLSLLPLGLILLAILSLPAIALAEGAAFIGRRIERRG